ncbi:MAG: hypothetical protein ACKV19_12380, partial [Verrucomicrobiales bacterium]
MATFSFGKFFGKGPRQPRFKAGLEAPGDDDDNESEVLPVGRLVSFTDDGPEDAPLFQEVEGEGEAASPFVVVDGGRPTGGGLPGPARSAGEEGFTAEELMAMVPAQCVRVGAVPSNQVIPLPPGVLRASLAAGQPAVLLSQLHQACPALFVAPSSLDEDLVVTLPPQKVQRLVSRASVTGSAAPGHNVVRTPLVGHGDFDVTGLGVSVPVPLSGGPPFAMDPGKVKLPPPRRRFDDLQGVDLRPMVEKHDPLAPPAVPFTELGSATPSAVLPLSAGKRATAAPAFEASPLPSAAPSSPFQVASSLPQRSSGRGDAFPKRYASPFSVVSPGEVPALLESPFARQPVVGHTPTPPPSPPSPPAAHEPDPVPRETPETPATVSLRLSALLQSQHLGTVGFDPDRVPPHVRVTLAADPLLAQVPNGRIKVTVAEVTAGLDPKYQPAFGKAEPTLELQVPMRELFDNLPQATSPTPSAPPVASTFETPFSLRASEDAPLTALNSPFRIVPPISTAPTP